MKTRIIGIISLGVLFAFNSCSGTEEENTENNEIVSPLDESVDTTQFLSELAAIENTINNAEGMPDEEDLREAITAFQDYASLFPEDEASPNYLLKASDIALTLDQPEKSVKILNRIITEYPEYPRMESVKYNKASHLDFELRDTTAAKKAYQEFIEEYPNSPLVNDCKARIENIRFSLEELLEQFEQNLDNNPS